MLGFGSRPRWSTSPMGEACGSGTSPGSVRCWASTRRISSATRWGPSTCWWTSPRRPRCCRCAARSRSAVAVRSRRTGTPPRSTTTTRRSRRCGPSWRRCSSIPRSRRMRRTCGGATSPASRRGPGSHWRRRGFAGLGWMPRRPRRASGPMNGSVFRSWWSRARGTSCYRRGGRPRSPGRSPVAARRSSTDAGHCPQIEQPDALADVLLGFFAEVG